MAQRAMMMVWAALFLPFGLLGALPPGFSSGDTVSIRADRAWEDEQPDIVHFSGNFLMKAADWSVSADSATLYGNLDDPETVVLEGSPAQVLVLRRLDDSDKEISGTAPQIEYQRKANIIKFSGGAVLLIDDNILRSDEIEYNIELDRYKAGGSEGVRIEVTPRE